MALMMLLALPAWAGFTPTADFIDHGDGTVTHKLTGLTWMRCSLGQTWTGTTCSGTPSHYTWDQAKALTLSFAGQSDWRLPTPWELASIVDYDLARPDPMINATVFPNTWSFNFWSASAFAGDSDRAWSVDFYVGNANLGGRSNYDFVRLVRGGQSSALLTTPSSDFIDRGDGTVTHKRTNLTWKRCAEGQSWTGSTCSGAANTYRYDQAVALTSNFAGQSDWRLPNVQELLSIVEYGDYEPAINAAIFPATPSSRFLLNFWSASANAGDSRNAWSVDFSYGVANGYSGRSNNYYHVRLVRGGQSFASFGSAGGATTNYAIATTANPTAGGTLSCTPNPVSSGGNSSCTATANSGYRFTGFSGDCSGTTCTLSNVTSAKSVTANFAAIAIDGACGSAHGGSFPVAPTRDLCLSGAASTISGSGPWTWNCLGTNGGATATCSAQATPIDGACGSAHGGSFAAAPTRDLCLSGAASTPSGAGPWTWNCLGTNGGATASCRAEPMPPTDGACGSAHGGSFAAAPTRDLCFSGAASKISGSGPWSWNCLGTNGGATAACSAQATPIDGACGSAHGKPVAKAPSANLCQQGAASPLQGDGPWAWICQGQNNGLSALCQAGKTCEFAGSLLPGAGCPAGSTSSTPPLWSLGDRPGKNRYLVAADANIELTIRSTPRPGDAPTRQWLYYRLRQGGVTQPYHLLTPQGSVPLDAAQAALENYGYPFSPQGLTTLLRTTPQSLGLQAGDELLYGHAYFAADGTLITDNSVSIEVR